MNSLRNLLNILYIALLGISYFCANTVTISENEKITETNRNCSENVVIHNGRNENIVPYFRNVENHLSNLSKKANTSETNYYYDNCQPILKSQFNSSSQDEISDRSDSRKSKRCANQERQNQVLNEMMNISARNKQESSTTQKPPRRRKFYNNITCNSCKINQNFNSHHNVDKGTANFGIDVPDRNSTLSGRQSSRGSLNRFKQDQKYFVPGVLYTQQNGSIAGWNIQNPRNTTQIQNALKTRPIIKTNKATPLNSISRRKPKAKTLSEIQDNNKRGNTTCVCYINELVKRINATQLLSLGEKLNCYLSCKTAENSAEQKSSLVQFSSENGPNQDPLRSALKLLISDIVNNNDSYVETKIDQDNTSIGKSSQEDTFKFGGSTSLNTSDDDNFNKSTNYYYNTNSLNKINDSKSGILDKGENIQKFQSVDVPEVIKSIDTLSDSSFNENTKTNTRNEDTAFPNVDYTVKPTDDKRSSFLDSYKNISVIDSQFDVPSSIDFGKGDANGKNLDPPVLFEENEFRPEFMNENSNLQDIALQTVNKFFENGSGDDEYIIVDETVVESPQPFLLSHQNHLIPAEEVVMTKDFAVIEPGHDSQNVTTNFEDGINSSENTNSQISNSEGYNDLENEKKFGNYGFSVSPIIDFKSADEEISIPMSDKILSGPKFSDLERNFKSNAEETNNINTDNGQRISSGDYKQILQNSFLFQNLEHNNLDIKNNGKQLDNVPNIETRVQNRSEDQYSNNFQEQKSFESENSGKDQSVADKQFVMYNQTSVLSSEDPSSLIGYKNNSEDLTSIISLSDLVNTEDQFSPIDTSTVSALQDPKKSVFWLTQPEFDPFIFETNLNESGSNKNLQTTFLKTVPEVIEQSVVSHIPSGAVNAIVSENNNYYRTLLPSALQNDSRENFKQSGSITSRKYEHINKIRDSTESKSQHIMKIGRKQSERHSIDNDGFIGSRSKITYNPTDKHKTEILTNDTSIEFYDNKEDEKDGNAFIENLEQEKTEKPQFFEDRRNFSSENDEQLKQEKSNIYANIEKEDSLSKSIFHKSNISELYISEKNKKGNGKSNIKHPNITQTNETSLATNIGMLGSELSEHERIQHSDLLTHSNTKIFPENVPIIIINKTDYMEVLQHNMFPELKLMDREVLKDVNDLHDNNRTDFDDMNKAESSLENANINIRNSPLRDNIPPTSLTSKKRDKKKFSLKKILADMYQKLKDTMEGKLIGKNVYYLNNTNGINHLINDYQQLYRQNYSIQDIKDFQEQLINDLSSNETQNYNNKYSNSKSFLEIQTNFSYSDNNATRYIPKQVFESLTTNITDGTNYLSKNTDVMFNYTDNTISKIYKQGLTNYSANLKDMEEYNVDNPSDSIEYKQVSIRLQNFTEHLGDNSQDTSLDSTVIFRDRENSAFLNINPIFSTDLNSKVEVLVSNQTTQKYSTKLNTKEIRENQTIIKVENPMSDTLLSSTEKHNILYKDDFKVSHSTVDIDRDLNHSKVFPETLPFDQNVGDTFKTFNNSQLERFAESNCKLSSDSENTDQISLSSILENEDTFENDPVEPNIEMTTENGFFYRLKNLESILLLPKNGNHSRKITTNDDQNPIVVIHHNNTRTSKMKPDNTIFTTETNNFTRTSENIMTINLEYYNTSKEKLNSDGILLNSNTDKNRTTELIEDFQKFVITTFPSNGYQDEETTTNKDPLISKNRNREFVTQIPHEETSRISNFESIESNISTNIRKPNLSTNHLLQNKNWEIVTPIVDHQMTSVPESYKIMNKSIETSISTNTEQLVKDHLLQNVSEQLTPEEISKMSDFESIEPNKSDYPGKPNFFNGSLLQFSNGELIISVVGDQKFLVKEITDQPISVLTELNENTTSRNLKLDFKYQTSTPVTTIKAESTEKVLILGKSEDKTFMKIDKGINTHISSTEKSTINDSFFTEHAGSSIVTLNLPKSEYTDSINNEDLTTKFGTVVFKEGMSSKQNPLEESNKKPRVGITPFYNVFSDIPSISLDTAKDDKKFGRIPELEEGISSTSNRTSDIAMKNEDHIHKDSLLSNYTNENSTESLYYVEMLGQNKNKSLIEGLTLINPYFLRHNNTKLSTAVPRNKEENLTMIFLAKGDPEKLERNSVPIFTETVGNHTGWNTEHNNTGLMSTLDIPSSIDTITGYTSESHKVVEILLNQNQQDSLNLNNLEQTRMADTFTTDLKEKFSDENDESRNLNKDLAGLQPSNEDTFSASHIGSTDNDHSNLEPSNDETVSSDSANPGPMSFPKLDMSGYTKELNTQYQLPVVQNEQIILNNQDADTAAIYSTVEQDTFDNSQQSENVFYSNTFNRETQGSKRLDPISELSQKKHENTGPVVYIVQMQNGEIPKSSLCTDNNSNPEDCIKTVCGNYLGMVDNNTKFFDEVQQLISGRILGPVRNTEMLDSGGYTRSTVDLKSNLKEDNVPIKNFDPFVNKKVDNLDMPCLMISKKKPKMDSVVDKKYVVSLLDSDRYVKLLELMKTHLLRDPDKLTNKEALRAENARMASEDSSRNSESEKSPFIEDHFHFVNPEIINEFMDVYGKEGRKQRSLLLKPFGIDMGDANLQSTGWNPHLIGRNHRSISSDNTPQSMLPRRFADFVMKQMFRDRNHNLEYYH